VLTRQPTTPAFTWLRESAYEFYVDLLMQLDAKSLARDMIQKHYRQANEAARSLTELLNEAHVDIEQGVGADLVKRSGN
jgi:hypothetical protein